MKLGHVHYRDQLDNWREYAANITTNAVILTERLPSHLLQRSQDHTSLNQITIPLDGYSICESIIVSAAHLHAIRIRNVVFSTTREWILDVHSKSKKQVWLDLFESIYNQSKLTYSTGTQSTEFISSPSVFQYTPSPNSVTSCESYSSDSLFNANQKSVANVEPVTSLSPELEETYMRNLQETLDHVLDKLQSVFETQNFSLLLGSDVVALINSCAKENLKNNLVATVAKSLLYHGVLQHLHCAHVFHVEDYPWDEQLYVISSPQKDCKFIIPTADIPRNRCPNCTGKILRPGELYWLEALYCTFQEHLVGKGCSLEEILSRRFNCEQVVQILAELHGTVCNLETAKVLFHALVDHNMLLKVHFTNGLSAKNILSDNMDTTSNDFVYYKMAYVLDDIISNDVQCHPNSALMESALARKNSGHSYANDSTYLSKNFREKRHPKTIHAQSLLSNNARLSDVTKLNHNLNTLAIRNKILSLLLGLIATSFAVDFIATSYSSIIKGVFSMCLVLWYAKLGHPDMQLYTKMNSDVSNNVASKSNLSTEATSSVRADEAKLTHDDKNSHSRSLSEVTPVLSPGKVSYTQESTQEPVRESVRRTGSGSILPNLEAKRSSSRKLLKVTSSSLLNTSSIDEDRIAKLHTFRQAIARAASVQIENTYVYTDDYLWSVQGKKGRAFAYAVEKMKKCLEWRISEGIDALSFSDVEAALKSGSMYWYGYDKQHQPILWVRPRLKDWKNMNRETEVKAHIYLLELACKYFMPKGVSTFTLIGDAAKVGPRELDVRLMLTLLETFTGNYPDRIGIIHVAHLNFIVQSLTKSLWILLPARLRDKFVFMKKPNNELSMTMDSKWIPDFMGGNAIHNISPKDSGNVFDVNYMAEQQINFMNNLDIESS